MKTRFWVIYVGVKTGKERVFPAKPFRSARKVVQTCNRLIDGGFASACRVVTEKPIALLRKDYVE